MNACAANTTRPMRSFRRLSIKSRSTDLAMLTRLTRSPLTTKSSEIMLPDKSSAHTMSMPLAFTSVVLFDKRGCASAKIKIASVSQRNAARKIAERFFLFRREQIRSAEFAQKFFRRAFRRAEIKPFFEIKSDCIGNQNAKFLRLRNQRESFIQFLFRADVRGHGRHDGNARHPLVDVSPDERGDHK